MTDRRLLALAGVAGSIDSVSYLALGQVFTANMTGNTVLLGLSAGQGRWTAAVRSAVALAGFCAGVAAGGAAVPRGGAARRALAWEAVAVAGVLIAWRLGVAKPWLIGGAAVAMGLQSAAVARVDTAGAATTFITGTLTRLLLRVVDRADVGSRAVALPAAILPVYCAAAAGAALALGWLGAWTLLLPLAALTAISVSVRPSVER